MMENMTRNWWMLVLRGVLAVIFGVLALILPGAALISLVLLFGIYAAVDGIANLAAAFNMRDNRWWNVLEGVVGILAGVVAFFNPALTGLALTLLIGAWAILTGIFEVVAAVRLRREIENEWWLAIGGVLSVIFGVLVFLSPLAGALAIAWLVGVYAILFGGTLIAVGLRFRGEGTSGEGRTPATV